LQVVRAYTTPGSPVQAAYWVYARPKGLVALLIHCDDGDTVLVTECRAMDVHTDVPVIVHHGSDGSQVWVQGEVLAVTQRLSKTVLPELNNVCRI
jgi:hypothetical protein